MQLNLWDVGGGGHGRYPQMLQMWCRNALGAIIVCDCTQLSTLDQVQVWKENLDENAVMPDNSPIPCLLVANKSDLLDQKFAVEKIDQDSLDIAWMNYKFIGNIFTSAVTGHNIEEAFDILANTIASHDLKDNLNYVGWSEDHNLRNNASDVEDWQMVQSFYESGSLKIVRLIFL